MSTDRIPRMTVRAEEFDPERVTISKFERMQAPNGQAYQSARIQYADESGNPTILQLELPELKYPYGVSTATYDGRKAYTLTCALDSDENSALAIRVIDALCGKVQAFLNGPGKAVARNAPLRNPYRVEVDANGNEVDGPRKMFMKLDRGMITTKQGKTFDGSTKFLIPDHNSPSGCREVQWEQVEDKSLKGLPLLDISSIYCNGTFTSIPMRVRSVVVTSIDRSDRARPVAQARTLMSLLEKDPSLAEKLLEQLQKLNADATPSSPPVQEDGFGHAGGIEEALGRASFAEKPQVGEIDPSPADTPTRLPRKMTVPLRIPKTSSASTDQ